MTRVLIGLNVIVYLLELMTHFPENRYSVFRQLEEYGPAIAAGEWWRLYTSAFMHASVTHILFNMLALYQLGSLVEQLVGRWRMGVIYFVAMTGAAITVYLFNYGQPTLGASGAVFGLFGAVVAFGLRLWPEGRLLINQVWGIILVNLIIGYVTPGVSNAAHIGGLLSGFIAGLALAPQRRRVAVAPPE